LPLSRRDKAQHGLNINAIAELGKLGEGLGMECGNFHPATHLPIHNSPFQGEKCKKC